MATTSAPSALASSFSSAVSPRAIRHMGGLPARLFLLLVGVSAAIKFETQLARGVDSATMRRQTAKRGLQIVGLAYLFRMQEHLLAGFHGGWPMLFKVDILNAIG